MKINGQCLFYPWGNTIGIPKRARQHLAQIILCTLLLIFTVAHNCRQNHFGHGKISFITAKSISSRLNQFHYGKINFSTAKSTSSRQNQLHHGKINFAHGKINLIRGKIIFTHGKINSTRDKIFFTRGKIFPTYSRDGGSQSLMGVNPTWRSCVHS